MKYKVDTNREPKTFTKGDDWSRPAPTPSTMKITSEFGPQWKVIRSGPLDLRNPGESWEEFYLREIIPRMKNEALKSP
jgi:hypothetical protein